MSAQSEKAKKRRMQRLSRLLPLLPLWPPVHCARLECWCCNQADAFLVAAPRSPVPRNEPSISSNSKPMQRSALPTKVLHGGSTHHSPCHRVTEFPFRDSNYHPQGNKQAAEASVRPPSVHEKSSFKPQPAGILGRHRSAREQDVTHILPLGAPDSASQRRAQRWRSS
jgi:hypothetical protein